MRKQWKFAVLSTVPVVFLLLMPVSQPDAAGSGCCMKRDRVSNDAPWYQIGNNFGDCDKLNRNEDNGRDDVFEPKGQIWWNVNC